jgi:hypothetical protein
MMQRLQLVMLQIVLGGRDLMQGLMVVEAAADWSSLFCLKVR